MPDQINSKPFLNPLNKIPQIETKRLILRAHTPADFNDCVKMWSDPLVTRFIGGKPFLAQQTWARMLNYVGHWAFMGFGYWAIEEKGGKNFIGELGFADHKREIKPSICDLPEIGWALTSSAHGKGFASEAIAAVIQWGDQNLETRRSACIINPANRRSIQLAEKYGYKWTQDVIYNESSVKMYFRDF